MESKLVVNKNKLLFTQNCNEFLNNLVSNIEVNQIINKNKERLIEVLLSEELLTKFININKENYQNALEMWKNYVV